MFIPLPPLAAPFPTISSSLHLHSHQTYRRYYRYHYDALVLEYHRTSNQEMTTIFPQPHFLLEPPPLLLLLLLLLLLPQPGWARPVGLAARDAVAQLTASTRTLCVRPAPWNQILSFFLTNYIARIATYKKASGYNGMWDYANVFVSLFVPFLGITSAADTIARGSRFLGSTDIDRALLAKALCILIRTPGWRPESGEVVRGCLMMPGDDHARRRLQRRYRKRRQQQQRHRRRRDPDAEKRGHSRGDYEAAERSDYEATGRGYSHSRSNRPDAGPSRSRSRSQSPGPSHRSHGRSHKRSHSHDRRASRSQSRSHRRHASRSRSRHGHPPPDELLGHVGAGIPEYSHSSGGTSSDDHDHGHDYDLEHDYAPDAATLIIGPPGLRALDRDKYKIHGHFSLPPGYTIAHLPPGTELMPLAVSRAVKADIVLSNSYSFVKAFAGLVQIVSSLYALYSAYGDETAVYGFAAVGFTVLPYTVMSLLNVVANVVEASYDCLFLVRSDVMREAERREAGEFVGEVAELVPADPALELDVTGQQSLGLRFRRDERGRWHAVAVHDEAHDAGPGIGPGGGGVPVATEFRVVIPPLDGSYDPAADPRAKIVVQPVGQSYRFSRESLRRAQHFGGRVSIAITVFALVTPYAVVGALSRFSRGNSSVRQRVFMTGWLVIGQVIGVLNLAAQALRVGRRRWWKWAEQLAIWIVVVIGFAFAVGGFVEAGRMLRNFGYCIKVGGSTGLLTG